MTFTPVFLPQLEEEILHTPYSLPRVTSTPAKYHLTSVLHRQLVETLPSLDLSTDSTQCNLAGTLLGDTGTTLKPNRKAHYRREIESCLMKSTSAAVALTDLQNLDWSQSPLSSKGNTKCVIPLIWNFAQLMRDLIRLRGPNTVSFWHNGMSIYCMRMDLDSKEGHWVWNKVFSFRNMLFFY